MTNYERRMELLNQMKHANVLDYSIHHYEASDKPKSTLGIRITICIICFICYILFDYGNLHVMNVDSKTVTNQIKHEMNLQNLQEKIKIKG